MTDSRPTAERVYSRLKADLMGGTLDMNVRLDFAALAIEYGASTTPVREAAMRLHGERLLEPHPRGGVRPELLTRENLPAMLELHRRLIGLALQWGRHTPVHLTSPLPEDTMELRARRMFASLVQTTGNGAFVDMADNLADRLAPVRALEHLVLGDIPDEIAALERVIDDRDALVPKVRRYHTRRIDNALSLVWLAAAGRADIPSG